MSYRLIKWKRTREIIQAFHIEFGLLAKFSQVVWALESTRDIIRTCYGALDISLWALR
jgi:hypothetical protein